MEDTNVKLVAIREDIKGIYAEVGSLTVTDQESFVTASDVRNKVRKRKTRVDELRKEAIAPFKEEVDRYNNLFRIELDNLDELLRKVDGKLISFTEEEERKAKEEQEKRRKEQLLLEAARKALQDQNPEIELTIAPAPLPEIVEAPKTTIRSESGTMSVKKILKYEVYDKELLMKTHPDFFCEDPVKIREFIRVIKEEKNIDGIKIYYSTILSSR